MNKRILVVLAAAIATMGVMQAKSDMVRIDSNEGFMFWGKKPVEVVAVYKKGKEQVKVTEGVQQKTEFEFNHRKKGKLLRLEIQNPDDTEPTIIENPKRGADYKIKFDKEDQVWVVEETGHIGSIH